MILTKRCSIRLVLLIAFLCSIDPSALRAQYFGQNKVHYKTFDFNVLKTEHFDVYYYPQEAQSARMAARMAERWYARHSEMLHHQLGRRQPLILYGSHPAFKQTNAISGQLGEGTGGVTEALKRRIVLPMGSTMHETDHVIGHELVHAFQYDITGEGDNSRVGFAAPTALRMPLWFIEGMAEFQSIGPVDPHTAMWMRDAVKRDSGENPKPLPDLRKLEDPNYFPYRYGQALLSYVAGRWGDLAIEKIMTESGKMGNLDVSIRRVLGIGPDTLANDWHAAMHDIYDPLISETSEASDYGKVVIEAVGTGNDLNVSPAVSPDGKYLLFLSSRSLFSIDLFLADAQSGEVLRKLTRTAVDPHFQSLQFIYSAGAWSPDGEQIVFAAVSAGVPLLSIQNVQTGETVREIKLNSLDEILNPTWSPDGKYIGFSAMKGGFSDLYTYALETDELSQLTDDPYADIHPSWSPDGRYIAFSTERFSTDLSDLKIGNYRLGLYDVNAKTVTPLPSFDHGKNINPQWSPDNGSIYFVSDQDGISNLYRLDITPGSFQKLTNLYTGISGITAISPAISLATDSGALLYSVFENGKYGIYSIEDVEKSTGAALTAKGGELGDVLRFAAVLPPSVRVKTDSLSLLEALNDTETGLPDDSTFSYQNYSPSLSLDYIGQPYLVAGSDRFGSFIGGGISLFWSDLMGNRNLATAMQVTNSFKDLTAIVAYQNSRHRWSWGGIVQQVPYTTGGFQSGYGTIGSDTLYIEEQLTQRQYNRKVAAVFQYPFSRARRFELTAGFNNIGFSQELEVFGYDPFSGAQVTHQKKDLPSPSSLNFVTTDLALVYDTSFFGATSPILGQRYRAELSPTLGSINYLSALADYRKYFMPIRPYTLAFRMLHYGRYGSGGEDGRLSPFFIGYPGLVRGYDYYSFDTSECGDDPDCHVINDLFGSKMAVLNAELRLPLWNLLTLGQGFFYGYLPIEVATFYDAGVAWTNDEKASFLDGDRSLKSSFGLALRLNLLGYVVLEWDYVHPYDRPMKGWLWQFSVTPGF